MKSTIVFTYWMFVSVTALAERTVLPNGSGSVQLPPGYVNVEKPGGILRPKDAKNAVFTKGKERIEFLTSDEGKLAEDAEKYFPEKKNILSKWSSKINGYKVNLILYENKNNPDRGGVIVSYPDLKVDFACDYLGEGHIASFLFVALSYRPAEKGGAVRSATVPGSKPERRKKTKREPKVQP